MWLPSAQETVAKSSQEHPDQPTQQSGITAKQENAIGFLFSSFGIHFKDQITTYLSLIAQGNIKEIWDKRQLRRGKGAQALKLDILKIEQSCLPQNHLNKNFCTVLSISFLICKM